MLRYDLKNIFTSKAFYFSVMVMAILAYSPYITQVVPYGGLALAEHMFKSPINVFHFAFPILAAMPYAPFIQEERISRYQINLILRSSRIKYTISKLITSWIVSFLQIALVVFICIIVSRVRKPHFPLIGDYMSGDYLGMSDAITRGHSWFVLFVLVAGVAGAAWFWSSVAILLSQYTRYKYILICTPLIIEKGLGAILVYISGIRLFAFENYASLSVFPSSVWLGIDKMLLIEAGAVLIVYSLYYLKVRKLTE